MAEYKNVENIKKLFDEEFKKTRRLIQKGETHLDNLAEGFLEADRVISKLPTADVVEVKHGYYERVNEDAYRCSICHCSPIADINNKWAFTNYCGNCGAKMQPTDFCSYGERSKNNA